MINFVTQIQTELTSIIDNAHHKINRDKVVRYPYVVFDVTAEEYNGNQEGAEIELHIIDYGTNSDAILLLEEQIRQHFQKKRLFSNDAYYQFAAGRSTPVETTDDRIQRRDLSILCKIDWRKKSWQENH